MARLKRESRRWTSRVVSTASSTAAFHPNRRRFIVMKTRNAFAISFELLVVSIQWLWAKRKSLARLRKPTRRRERRAWPVAIFTDYFSALFGWPSTFALTLKLRAAQ